MWLASPTRSSPQRERDDVAGLQLDDVLAQRSDAQLGPGQVLQDRHGSPRAPGRIAHAPHGLLVLGEGAVGVVQAGHVHPGAHHREQRLGLARGGADGGDDLGAAHCRATVAGAARPRAWGGVGPGLWRHARVPPACPAGLVLTPALSCAKPHACPCGLVYRSCGVVCRSLRPCLEVPLPLFLAGGT